MTKIYLEPRGDGGFNVYLDGRPIAYTGMPLTIEMNVELKNTDRQPVKLGRPVSPRAPMTGG